MSHWLTAWLNRPSDGGTLAARLVHNVPYVTPHPGPGRTLSDAQAQASLAHFQAVLPQRLQQVGAVLRDEAGIDLAAALADPKQHAGSLADALQAWAATTWPALPPRPRPTLVHWLGSQRSGGDIFFSLLLDLTIALGELIHRSNPAWRWDLDRSAQNIADDMISARRVVLLAEPVGDMPQAFVLDVEHVVVHRFLHAEDAGQRLLNPFRRLVDEALRGDAMAHWRRNAGTAQDGRGPPT